MASFLKTERELLSAPGDDIFEIMEHIKMSLTELAALLGKTLSQINDLIYGEKQITPDIASKLEEIFRVDARYWLRREMNYRKKLTFIKK